MARLASYRNRSEMARIIEEMMGETGRYEIAYSIAGDQEDVDAIMADDCDDCIFWKIVERHVKLASLSI